MLALLLLWPFHRREVRSDGDVPTTVAFMSEAAIALADGQFPVRVTPRLFGGVGYPMFQFYGNFPLTLGGALSHLPRFGPYDAWRVIMFAALLCGGLYTYRCAMLFVGRGPRGRTAAAVAGASFMAAPFMLTDIFPRGAFGEAVAFNLLPCLLFHAWRTFRRPGVRHVVATSVAWALIGLTHNITYLYTCVFVGVLFLSFARPRAAYLRRAARLFVACALHAALLAWYFVPQITLLPHLVVTAELRAELWDRTFGMVPLLLMLAPVKVALPRTGGLGVQIGWPLLGGAVGAAAGAIAYARQRRRSSTTPEANATRGLRGRESLLRGVTWRLNALLVAAVFIAWSPVDFWPYLPEMFRFVQFPFRLLVFASTCGALLLGLALRFWFPQGMRTWQLLAMMAAIGLTSGFHEPATHLAVPGLSGKSAGVWLNIPANDYMLARPTGRAPDPPAAAAAPANDGNSRRARFAVNLERETRLQLPLLYYRELLRVRLDGLAHAYDDDAGYVAVTVPSGRHVIEVWFAGTAWANVVSGLAWSAVAAFAVAAGFVRIARRARRHGRRASPSAVDRQAVRRATLTALAAFAAGLFAPAAAVWLWDTFRAMT